MKYFFDNNISPKLVRMLREAEIDATHLRDEFESDAADALWIPVVATENRIVVTVDHRILTRPHERAAWASSGVRIVFLPKGFLALRFYEQLSWFFAAWPTILEEAERLRAGGAVRLTMNKKAERLK